MDYYDKVNKTYDYDSITKRIKHIFLECKDDRKKFAETVIEYFTPTAREKKNNAEIPTPRELKLEMTSKVPEDFWTEKQKVLEPSVGKGGFCLEVIEFFMKGLEEKIPDEEERYKIIVEECLYFADINPVNIHITKLILDPNNEYKLNFYEGDTLKLDIKQKWDIDGFDLVIGNPPYEKINSSGDNKLYLDFTKKSLELLKINSFLLFITPRNILDYLLLVDKNRSYIDELYQIDLISLETSNKYFDVSCIFTYFLLRKIKLYDITKIEYLYNDTIHTTTIKLHKEFKIPKIINKIDLDILNKIQDNKNNYDFKNILFDNKKSQRIRTNHIKNGIVKENCDDIFNIKIIDTINKTNPFPGKFYFYNKKDIYFNSDKIIISKKGYMSPYLDTSKKYTYSDNFLTIIDTKSNLKKIMLLLKSPIVEYLIFQYSKNGFDKISSISNLKKLNLNKINYYSDLYKIYKLNKNEVEYICKMINFSSNEDSKSSPNGESSDEESK